MYTWAKYFNLVLWLINILFNRAFFSRKNVNSKRNSLLTWCHIFVFTDCGAFESNV